MIKLTKQWDRQPHGAAGIDPRWRGITDVFVGSSLCTVVLGSAVDVVGASFTPSLAGIAASMQTGLSNRLLISTDQKKIVPDGQSATIGVLRRCRDTTARASSLFGYVNGSTDRVQAHAPYSDGNLYWDFGNTTTSSGGGRISVAFPKSTEWEVLVFVAGPKKGREVWRNATKIASNTSLTATKTSASSSFAVGNAFNGAVSADNEDIALFFASSAEWSDAEIVSWVSNPWQLFEPQRIWVPVSITSSGNYTVTADSGTYSVTGQTATLLRNKVVSANYGTYSFTGQSANITYTPTGTNYTLVAEKGDYTYTGQGATIQRSKYITANGGTYTLTGQNATVSYSGSNTIVLKAGSWLRYRIIQ